MDLEGHELTTDDRDDEPADAALAEPPTGPPIGADAATATAGSGVNDASATDDPPTTPPDHGVEVRGVDVAYGRLQVLFDVDLDVSDGEIVALLGTNGAGKSTLLKAMCGLLPHRGAVRLGELDLTGRSAEQIVRAGVALMPGGKAIFPTLSVRDHLRLSCWTFRGDGERIAADLADVHELFPVLAERADQLAGDLSGGEQQQLALAMTLMLRPKVMLIDELSLGLAPMVVGALCDVVRRMNANGLTVVVVEQSVNVALTLAERAVFLEKGRVRFEGPTKDLLDRPDILRSVFLEGTGAHAEDASSTDDDEPSDLLAVDLRRFDELAEPAPAASADDDEPVLVCSGVTKRFGGVNALSDVGLEVAPGEIVGLIGQNGAGKTTLMDCISGFHDLDDGRVVFRGVDITGWSPHERARSRLGRSFQEARLFPSLTVLETIEVAMERTAANRSLIADATRQPASYLAAAEAADRSDELVAMLGLERYRHTPTSALSTGTRRIVELACLLAEDPVLMLLDEPSAGVAQRETEALGPLLGRIRDHTGAAMLVIEHDMPLLSGLCDRLVAMELGSVIASGSPEDVLADPAVVASYLGTDAAAINRSGAALA